jgi:DNA-binding MarR family transcriptional regulator
MCTQTDDFARRFLRVLEVLGKLAGHHPPDDLAQLHLNQLHTLYLLARQPGMAQKDIAERLQITPAAVSNAVREMEALGLVERQPDPEDARQMRLFLGQRGQQIVDEMHTRRCRAVADLLSALPPDEQQMVVEALERALAARHHHVSERD